MGVDPDDIEPHRVAVVRGRVLDAAGMGVPEVEVTVLRRGEFGYTLTRLDGGFDLAVNAGGPLTVCYRAAGFIPLQRQVRTSWRDYRWLPDVVMTPYDFEVTQVDLDNAADLQVHRAAAVTDAAGAMSVEFSQQAVLHVDGSGAAANGVERSIEWLLRSGIEVEFRTTVVESPIVARDVIADRGSAQGRAAVCAAAVPGGGDAGA